MEVFSVSFHCEKWRLWRLQIIFSYLLFNYLFSVSYRTIELHCYHIIFNFFTDVLWRWFFRARARVCVAVKPEVEPFSITDSTLNEGGSAKILCSASSGDTPMHFLWTVDDRLLTDVANGDHLKVQRLDELTSLLSLTKASPEDAGNYTCVAQNEAGSASRTATLKVMGKIIIYACL